MAGTSNWIVRIIFGKWSLALKVLPIAVVLMAVKYGFHHLNWEFISINPLFSGLLAAAVFLLGFLISGVLSDYKESEKLPGEIAIGLEAMIDQMQVLYLAGKSPLLSECQKYVDSLSATIQRWLYGEESFDTVMCRVGELNAHAAELQKQAPPQFVARLLQEQTALRRTLTRIHVIRETSFIKSAYAIAELVVFLLVVGLILAKIDPFSESLFFQGMISFLLVYLLLLIRDLDDPFEYSRDRASGPDEVSLEPLLAFDRRRAEACSRTEK
jgi:hypothetical protein